MGSRDGPRGPVRPRSLLDPTLVPLLESPGSPGRYRPPWPVPGSHGPITHPTLDPTLATLVESTPGWAPRPPRAQATSGSGGSTPPPSHIRSRVPASPRPPRPPRRPAPPPPRRRARPRAPAVPHFPRTGPPRPARHRGAAPTSPAAARSGIAPDHPPPASRNNRRAGRLGPLLFCFRPRWLRAGMWAGRRRRDGGAARPARPRRRWSDRGGSSAGRVPPRDGTELPMQRRRAASAAS